MEDQILFLTEKDVRSLLTPSDAISAAEEVFRHIGMGDITVGDMALMYADKEKRNNFHSMPAILHYKNVAGVKWISTYGNPLPGNPFCHGTLVILSDTRSGVPIALVGAANITAMRTAGGHGVVQAKHLCLPEPGTLSVFGCGSQARAGIRGMLTQFPCIKQIRLFSRSRKPMEDVREEWKGKVEVVLCDDPLSAVSESPLVLMASGATTPLLTWDMLHPGMTVIGMEGFRDMDPQIGKRADKWFLGYRRPDTYILKSSKLNPEGYLKEEDVFGDMTELLTGQICGREREDEIIVSTHMGMGAHDVLCALIAYERARERRIGQIIFTK